MTTALSLPRGLPDRIAAEARAAGASAVETGGYLLAEGSQPVSVLALTGTQDIHRERGIFHIGSRAMATLFDWASVRSLRVVAQWHSHRYEAFLSETDLAYGFNVPGFRTCVVPDYEQPSSDPRDWGWWLFDQEWMETSAPVVVTGPFDVITFEAGNVREH
jgi:hypothetical protein